MSVWGGVLTNACWVNKWRVSLSLQLRLPGAASGKEHTCRCRGHKRCWFDPCIRKVPWRRAWQFTPEFLPGKSHGQRSLAGYSPSQRVEHDWSDLACSSSISNSGPWALTALTQTSASTPVRKGTDILTSQCGRQSKKRDGQGSAVSGTGKQQCFPLSFFPEEEGCLEDRRCFVTCTGDAPGAWLCHPARVVHPAWMAKRHQGAQHTGVWEGPCCPGDWAQRAQALAWGVWGV